MFGLSGRRLIRLLLGFPGLLCFLFLLTCNGLATTIRSVSVSELLSQSELIFEGTVLDTYVHGNESHPSSIRTCAVFEILEIIKGEPPEGLLELCFSGGRRGQTTRLIHSMVYPVPGETGIYFVASPRNIYVNPLYGWQQGRFLIVSSPEANTSIVTAGNGLAVIEVQSGAAASGPVLSTGVPRGARVDGSGSFPSRGMAAETFKSRLREILRELQ